MPALYALFPDPRPLPPDLDPAVPASELRNRSVVTQNDLSEPPECLNG
ncbi:hypothetical protein [Streptomyces viridosporus]